MPGGPIKRQDDSRTAVLGHAALGAELADRQILGDAPLHVVETFVVGVQHLARVHRIEALLGPLRPGDRQQPVEIRADHGRLGVRVAHPLETVQLALGLLPHRVGHARARNLLAVFVGDGAVVLAELLANGVHLTPQEVLALLLLRAVFDVVVDALAHLQLRQPLALKLQRQLEPLDDVERFEELQLLGEVQVGRIAGGVGQRARVGDGPHERADPSVVAAQLENLVDDGAVFALQLAGEGGRRRLVRTRLRQSTRSTPSCVGAAAPGIARWSAVSDTASPRPASRTRSDTSATTPTRRVGVVLPRHQEHASSLPTSTDSVTGMPGNTTVSSRGMIRSLFIVRPE